METLLTLFEGTLGAAVMALSGVIFLITIAIVFPIVAFTVTWWWGLLCLILVGPATLVFTILHFQKAKVPFLVTIVSGALTIGILLLRSFMATFFAVAP